MCVGRMVTELAAKVDEARVQAKQQISNTSLMNTLFYMKCMRAQDSAVRRAAAEKSEEQRQARKRARLEKEEEM